MQTSAQTSAGVPQRASSVANRVVRAITADALGEVLILAIAFLMPPFLLDWIGNDAYGLWILISSLIGFCFAFSDVGLSWAVARTVAGRAEIGDWQVVNRAIGGALGYSGVAAIVIGALALLAFLSGPGLLGLNPALASVWRPTVTIATFALLLSLPFSLFAAVIQGSGRLALFHVINTTLPVLTAIIGAVGVWLGFGLPGYAFGMLAATACVLMLTVAIVKRNYPNVALRLRLPSTLSLELRLFASSMFLIGLMQRFVSQADPLILASTVGVESVAKYSIGFQLAFVAMRFIQKVADAFFPDLARLAAAHEGAHLRRLYLWTGAVSVGAGGLMAIGIVFVGPRLIQLWLGERIHIPTPLFVAFAALPLLHSIIHPSIVLLMALGQLRRAVVASVADVVLKLVLSFALAQSMGLIGVVVGTLVAHLLTVTWYLAWQVARAFAIPIREFTRVVLMPTFLALVPTVTVELLLDNLVPELPVVKLLVVGIAIVCVYGAGFSIGLLWWRTSASVVPH